MLPIHVVCIIYGGYTVYATVILIIHYDAALLIVTGQHDYTIPVTTLATTPATSLATTTPGNNYDTALKFNHSHVLFSQLHQLRSLYLESTEEILKISRIDLLSSLMK